MARLGTGSARPVRPAGTCGGRRDAVDHRCQDGMRRTTTTLTSAPAGVLVVLAMWAQFGADDWSRAWSGDDDDDGDDGTGTDGNAGVGAGAGDAGSADDADRVDHPLILAG